MGRVHRRPIHTKRSPWLSNALFFRWDRMEAVAIRGAFSGSPRVGTEVGPVAWIGAWFGPMLEEMQKLGDVLNPSVADPEKRREYESVLKQVWSKLVITE